MPPIPARADCPHSLRFFAAWIAFMTLSSALALPSAAKNLMINLANGPGPAPPGFPVMSRYANSRAMMKSCCRTPSSSRSSKLLAHLLGRAERGCFQIGETRDHFIKLGFKFAHDWVGEVRVTVSFAPFHEQRDSEYAPHRSCNGPALKYFQADATTCYDRQLVPSFVFLLHVLLPSERSRRKF